MSTTNTTAETTTPNIWRRRLVSLVGAGYLALMCWFSYLVIFYDFTATNKFLFCLTLCAVSFAALSAMLYSRFQILTRLTSILLLPAILPQILLCFGQWELILPIAVTSLIIFFLSGAGETVKTVFGVIYLLLYVLGSLAFFMLMSFFTPSTQQTILENGESPSGAYRYEIRDIPLPFLTFVSNGYDRTVYEERPIPSEVGSAQWSTVSRADITAQLLAISEDVTLDLSKSQKATIGIPSDTETVYLKDLTDSQLEQLGVPAENDVLTFADKTCFRSYIAVLEDYFAKDNREISLFN